MVTTQNTAFSKHLETTTSALNFPIHPFKITDNFVRYGPVRGYNFVIFGVLCDQHFGHDEHRVDTKDSTSIARKSSTKEFELRPAGTATSFSHQA